MRATTHRPILVAAFVLLAGFFFVSCQAKAKEPVSAGSGSPAPAARTIEVVFTQGDVRIDGKAVDIGSAVARRVRVETGPASRCDLVFDGANVLSVGQNAVALLDFSSAAVAVSLERGGLTSVLRKLEKLADRASFDITTKETIASVRGTSFCVWADSTSTYVCACNGAVHTVDSVGGNPLDLASAHHLARIYSVKDGTVTVAEGTLLHHDDASVQSAASRIGYTIDWTKQD